MIGAPGVPTDLLGGPRGSACGGFAVFFAGVFAGALDVAFAGVAAWVCVCARAEVFPESGTVTIARISSAQMLPMNLQPLERVLRFNAASQAKF